MGIIDQATRGSGERQEERKNEVLDWKERKDKDWGNEGRVGEDGEGQGVVEDEILRKNWGPFRPKLF